MKFFEITKLQAAEKQIEMAARLYFNDLDSISIHTLISAGHQILIDLGKASSVSLPHNNLDLIKPEFRDKFRKKLREPQNFFKHADKDPHDKLRFTPELNETSLLYSVFSLKQFVPELPFYSRAFLLYYRVKEPMAFLGNTTDFLEFADSVRNLSKEEFLKNMRESEIYIT